MAATVEFLRAAVRRELPDDLNNLISDDQIDGWLNRGVARLMIWDEKTSAITWTAGDASITLPTDFVKISDVRCNSTSALDPYTVFDGKMFFDDPDGASADGGATLFYYASFPEINGTNDSTLTSQGDEALILYCLYRVFRYVSNSRSVYTRYATLAGANGVDIGELERVAQNYLLDFEDFRDDLRTLLNHGTIWYQDGA